MHKYVCITTYQPDTKSYPNPNPMSKQHAIVNIQLNMSYAINSHETCCCTLCTTVGWNCHTATSLCRWLIATKQSDVQDSADVIAAVSEPAHLVAHQHTQHSIVVRPTAVRTISMDIICQTIVQHCRTSDLELTATCRIKLRISLYLQIQT